MRIGMMVMMCCFSGVCVSFKIYQCCCKLVYSNLHCIGWLY